MGKLKFSDILIAVMLGVLFGVIMKFWNDLYAVVKPIMPTFRQLIYGMWFMVGPFTYLLLRKPGVALIASLAGGMLSALIDQQTQILAYAAAQGLGAELLFLAFRYRKYKWVIGGFAGIASCFAGLFLDLAYGYAQLELWALFVKYGLRTISAFLFTGVLAYAMIRALEATGVTHLLRPISKKEYSELNQ